MLQHHWHDNVAWGYFLQHMHKVGVSHDIVGHVAFYEQLVHSVCRDGSVEGMVDGTVAHIGSVHLPRQVEVDGVGMLDHSA